jgi:hypothetical protein
MSFFRIAKGFHKLSKHPPPQLTHNEIDKLRAITMQFLEDSDNIDNY